MKLQNTNDYAVPIKSSDGETYHLMPRAEIDLPGSVVGDLPSGVQESAVEVVAAPKVKSDNVTKAKE
jgi:hypothetical protein